MNYSKFAITTLIASSLFVACSDKISENTIDTQYIANTGNIKNAGQAVDLGLPSGTKWANMNVGATSEYDNGILFVWGDITGTQMMATTPTSYTDVVAALSTSALFDKYKDATVQSGEICDTTNVLKSVEPKMIDLSFIPDTTGLDSLTRAGYDVQKMNAINAFVKAKLNLVKESNPGFLEAALTNEGFALIYNWDDAKSEFVERIPSQKTMRDTLDYYKKFEYASNSTLTVDVMGSTKVDYYVSSKANNYTEIKDQFGAVIRRDYIGGQISNIPIYSIVSSADQDPATANWGNSWRMPTTEELQELIDKCKWEFTGTGYKVTGPNENSIFLPAAGYRYGDKWYGNGNAGYYASGEITGSYSFPSMADQNKGSKGEVVGNENMPNMLIFQHGNYANGIGMYHNLSTSYGISIRPVAK